MQRGFTLIELAIVLVIIGLLVGGVLVGRDLIQSAGINAVARDIDSYNVGAMTFRDKYGGIPGDITASKAQQFGLTISATNPGTTGEGDGDGVLGNGTIVNAGLGGEDTLFWRQLSDAQLIPFGSTADGTTLDTTAFAGNLATTVSTLTPLIPALRIRSTAFVYAFSYQSVNYLEIGQWSLCGGVNGGMCTDVTLTAREALGIDQKTDDGYPDTGVILSTYNNALNTAPRNGGAPSTGNTLCYDNSTTPGRYATTSRTIADTVRCALRIKAGF